jgi:hypothetical protein
MAPLIKLQPRVTVSSAASECKQRLDILQQAGRSLCQPPLQFPCLEECNKLVKASKRLLPLIEDLEDCGDGDSQLQLAAVPALQV